MSAGRGARHEIQQAATARPYLCQSYSDVAQRPHLCLLVPGRHGDNIRGKREAMTPNWRPEVTLKFEPRDLWVGVYWTLSPFRVLMIYVCIVPTLPIRL